MLPDLDPVIHAPVRLGVVSVLAGLPEGRELTFSDVQELLALSPGNLSTHLRKLEEAGYVTVTKAFRERVPTTTVCLTPRGRVAFADYARAITNYLDASAAESLPQPEETS